MTIQTTNETRILYYILGIILVIFILQWLIDDFRREDDEPDDIHVLALVYRQRVKEMIMGIAREDGKRNRYRTLPECSQIPSTVIGNLSGSKDGPIQPDSNTTMEDVIRWNQDLLPGGSWMPRDCLPRHRLAVIIPYRDRYGHLVKVLSKLIPTLKRQQLDFRIYVTEQYGDDTFNKGLIMNAAYIEALKERDWQCFVFHDVDLLPEDDRNMYTCPNQPRHLSVAIDEMNYTLKYEILVGGVLMFRTEHFRRVNGYSNLFWGWGAEDDDMAERILSSGFRISRPPTNVARYRMIQHVKRQPAIWKIRYGLLYKSKERKARDGVSTAQYKLVNVKKEPLYTHFMIDVGKPPR